MPGVTAGDASPIDPVVQNALIDRSGSADPDPARRDSPGRGTASEHS